MTQKFIILSTQRSGSTWVVDMLNSHKAILSYSELLLENAEGKPIWGGCKDQEFFNSYLKAEKQRHQNINVQDCLFDYLDKLYAKRDGIEAIGFKLMYGQAGAYGVIIDYLVSRKVSIIHLIRRNSLDIILSKEAAAQRSMYHSRSDDIEPVKLTVDLNEIKLKLLWQEKEIHKARKKYANLKLPYCEVYYEDLLSGKVPFQYLLKFINIEGRVTNLESSLKRTNKEPHSKIIENYEQLKSFLENSKYSSMIKN